MLQTKMFYMEDWGWLYSRSVMHPLATPPEFLGYAWKTDFKLYTPGNNDDADVIRVKWLQREGNVITAKRCLACEWWGGLGRIANGTI